MRQGTFFRVVLLLVFLLLEGCASAPPVDEYTIARTAIEAAKAVEGARYASGFWYKAEESYRKGAKAYKQNDFVLARKYFKKTIKFAEKAENLTRLKKFQLGEGFP